MFDEKDRLQLAKLGIAESQALQQINYFKNGFAFTELLKPATIGDGLLSLNAEEALKMASIYDAASGNLDVLKFVPASGAATRMFKDLYSFWNDLNEAKPAEALFLKYPDVKIFFDNLEKFPFHEDISQAASRPVRTLLKDKEYKLILEYFLAEKGLNYGFLPKGLLKFHRYNDKVRTSIEEHWIEGVNYAKSLSGTVKVHFTISPNHESNFKKLIALYKNDYELAYKIKLEISYSFQKPSTDVIAVNMQNEPFRESDGSIVFRPGGHGALIENLNDCSADLIFIKNIDNVVTDRLMSEITLYKKALGGILISYRNKIFNYINNLEKGCSEEQIIEIIGFIHNELHYFGYSEVEPINKDYLLSVLNRPIRVCGMVKNEGEPGGGPFWTKDKHGNISLQIVETSQVDMNNSTQKICFNKSTHFNPVDIVCQVKNYKNEKFNLLEYNDPETGFITIKTKDGKSLKAQELPGLWNGAMAYWNTFFVEVPLVTFNPVKTVNDLLRLNHI